MANESSPTEPWLAYLDAKWIPYDAGTVEHDLALILKAMLLSTSSDSAAAAAAAAAQRINTYYCDRTSETTGSLYEFQNVDGITDFLNLLYHMIIGLGLQFPCQDSRQDTLVQLVVALRDLPPEPGRPSNGDRLVGPGEPMFIEMLEDTWTGASVYEERERVASPAEWKTECEEWVNFSAFLARCVGARVDEHVPDIGKYPRIEIPDGLEKDVPPGILRDTRVMVAAQYILLAGSVFDEETVQKPIMEKGSSRMLDKWPLWAGKLEELAEKELAPEVKTAVIEARKKLISLHPELFSSSEGGSKLDL